MTLLRQIIQLLSNSPGNIVYHLITLFALQAIFAISFSHWRRNRTHEFAAHSMWAAGAIFLTRVVLLGVSLFLANDLQRARTIIPFLEQALNTVTAFFIVWALVPHSRQLPQLGNLLLLMGILINGAMTISFAPTWIQLAADDIAYNSTSQATVWGLLQMIVFTGGLVLAAHNARWRSTLSPVILLFMLLATVAHFWNYPEIISSETNISYWIRLGNLASFPLWAAMAYRQSLLPLLVAQRKMAAPVNRLPIALRRAAQTMQAADRTAVLQAAMNFLSTVVEAPFVGIGVFSPDQQQLLVTSNMPQAGANQPRSWQLHMSDWSMLQVVMNQHRWVELRPEGSGAGQLHRLYEHMEISSLGALLLQPMMGDGRPAGILMLAQSTGVHEVRDDNRHLAPAAAEFVVAALHNVEQQPRELPALAVETPASPGDDEQETAVSGRVIALEELARRLQEQLEVAQNRQLQAEKRATAAGKRAHDLAATLAEIERVNQDERAVTLEQEIDVLRESLIEAEEALALASAGEGGLSTEWVMLTITRYSGQLEEAQARIEALEKQVARHEGDVIDPILISLIQELRTPMTSIAGFTELMLAETVGVLGVRQRDLLQRVKANSERMGTLLDQIVQLTTPQEQPAVETDELVNVREVIETAVSTIITQVREKRLNLDLDIADELPQMPINRHDLHQIMSNLLGNACQVSQADGRIMISAAVNVVPSGPDELEEQIRFLQLSVADSGGGIPIDDRARVFDPQHSADLPLIAGVGDTGAGLSMARTLTMANGGRIWLESQKDVGSTFSVLFPIGSPESNTQPSANGQLPDKD